MSAASRPSTYYYVVSAVTPIDETLPSDEVFSTDRQQRRRPALVGRRCRTPTSYRVYRGTSSRRRERLLHDDRSRASSTSARPSHVHGARRRPARWSPGSRRRSRSSGTPPRATSRRRSRSCPRSAPATSPSPARTATTTSSSRERSATRHRAAGRQHIVAPLERRSRHRHARRRRRQRHLPGQPDRRPHELADQRLRLRLAADGNDSLDVNGTDFADVFLLRAATADDGLAFIALINGPTPLTAAGRRTRSSASTTTRTSRSIVVNGGNGDDQFYMDDTRAAITVNGDEGNDFFQIGQLYKLAPHAASRRRRARGRLRHDRHDAGLAEQRHQQADDDQRRHRRRQLHRLPQPRHARPERRRRQRHVPRPGLRARRLAGRPPRADRPERRRRRRPDPVRGRRAR